MTFDRTAYQRTLYNTTELDESMLAVLVLMATHCDAGLRLRVRSMSQTKLMATLHWGIDRARSAVRRLETAKLLTVITHDRCSHYQLPSEDQLARYVAPVDPHKKQKHEKLSALARAAQIQARKKISH